MSTDSKTTDHLLATIAERDKEIERLNERKAALEATLKTSATIVGLSLLDFLN